MKLNKLDTFFWRISIWLTVVFALAVLGFIIYEQRTSPQTQPVKTQQPHIPVSNLTKQPDKIQNPPPPKTLSQIDSHLRQLDSPALKLFTLDFWYADDTFAFGDEMTCSGVTPMMAEYVATAIKSAWERLPGKAQLRFQLGKVIFCHELSQRGRPLSAVYLKRNDSEHEDVFFSLPDQLEKTPKAIRGAFFSQLFALAERQFGSKWAETWDSAFTEPTPANTLQGFDYPNSQQERADWFRFLMQDKDTVFKHVSLSKNTVLLDKLRAMQTLIADEWHITLEFTPIPPTRVAVKQPTSPSAAQRVFDTLMSKNCYQAIKPIKNLSAAEAEKVFGIRGLQFAPNNFARDLPFKLGFAHTDVDVFGNNCKSSTPVNVAMSGRYLSTAWKKLPKNTQKRLGLKFVFFCSEIIAANGAKMGGLATSFHDTVFIRIPQYSAQNAQFIQKVFLHELFHYAEFRERIFFNHPWDNVFSGYANTYRQDLANSRYGSGNRGFLNAYSMTYSAEERAELFSELMMNPNDVINFARRKNDTVLSIKIARMKQIMQINWGVRL